MAVKVTAYKARNGKMFTTEEEADAADICDAAEVLAGDDAALRSHIENVALGKSGWPSYTCRTQAQDVAFPEATSE